MAGRPLNTEESALWARAAAAVRALGRRKPDPVPVAELPPVPRPAPPRPSSPIVPARVERVGGTLDGAWDRRLRQGVVAPDRTIDLHGHTLASAHAALDHALERAIADDVRLL